MGRIEDAFHKTIAAASLEKQLRTWMKNGQLSAHTTETAIEQAKQQGLLDQFSVERLLSARKAVLNAIRVDEFPADYFKHSATFKRWPAMGS